MLMFITLNVYIHTYNHLILPSTLPSNQIFTGEILRLFKDNLGHEGGYSERSDRLDSLSITTFTRRLIQDKISNHLQNPPISQKN